VLAGTVQAILYFAPEGVVINRIPSGKIQQARRSGFVNPTRSGMQKERAMTEGGFGPTAQYPHPAFTSCLGNASWTAREPRRAQITPANADPQVTENIATDILFNRTLKLAEAFEDINDG
jgi:hypothetical protein